MHVLAPALSRMKRLALIVTTGCLRWAAQCQVRAARSHGWGAYLLLSSFAIPFPVSPVGGGCSACLMQCSAALRPHEAIAIVCRLSIVCTLVQWTCKDLWRSNPISSTWRLPRLFSWLLRLRNQELRTAIPRWPL